MHPRNRHQGEYDFVELIKNFPDLGPFVTLNLYKKLSIDFADPKAIKTLNSALLKYFYGVSNWEIPLGYLCPPIPGRADYLHTLADLLSTCNGGLIPRGRHIRALDIGVGANCIYPILGHCEYGWDFVGADSDAVALDAAKQIIKSNKKLLSGIELRLQKASSSIFEGLIQPHEVFDVSMCNPPFHSSLEEARKSSLRKWKNLGHTSTKGKTTDRVPVLNFGGQGTELWYPGGEASFVRRMIEESTEFRTNVFWFSTLISKASNLRTVALALKKANVIENRMIEMGQGQKKSRIVAWTFLGPKEQKEWRARRWTLSS